ncbi:MAG: LysM domain-containing protein [Gemmatimonadota bacterium]|jgi:nucleoid-associated protein YgaU
MAVATDHGSRRRLQAIRSAEAVVRQDMRRVQEQLKRLSNQPGTRPWISFHRTARVQELRSPHRTLKEALRADLSTLRDQLRDLRSQRVRARTRAVRADAAAFERRVRRTLDHAARTSGGISGEDLAELAGESEDILEQQTNLMLAHPSAGNLAKTLEYWGHSQELGGDPESEVQKRTWLAVGQVAQKLHARSEKEFRKVPTVENFDRMLEAWATSQLLGGGDLPEPEGWMPAATTHVVEDGDTLSKLSLRYYGSPGFWDRIYLENVRTLGRTVRLRPGTTLRIP